MGGTIALITRSEVLIVFITGYIDALVDVQSDITALNWTELLVAQLKPVVVHNGCLVQLLWGLCELKFSNLG